MVFIQAIIIFVVLFFLSGLKVVKEYERGVKFTLGKYVGNIEPGLRLVIPVLQSWQRIDLRVKTNDVPSQDCISKDNIPIKVNAVLYYRIDTAEKAVLEVEHFNFAVSQLAQTTMRNIIGEFELDDILAKREKISKQIKEIVDKETDPWGIKVTQIEVKDIELPDNMKRTIARVAEAERERKATILKAEGETIAAKSLAKAAADMSKYGGALHLRTLQTLNDISSDPSTKIVIGLPMELLKAFEGMSKKK